MNTNNTSNEGASDFNGSEGQPIDTDSTQPTSGQESASVEQGTEAMREEATDTVNESTTFQAADTEPAAQATVNAGRFVDTSVLVMFTVFWTLIVMVVGYYGLAAATALGGPVVGPTVFTLLTLVLCFGPVTSKWLARMVECSVLKLQDLVDYFKVRKATKAEQQAKNLANVMANFVDPVAAV